MKKSNEKAEDLKQPLQQNAADDPKLQSENKDADTAPDEFIAPNADTDEPVDGEIINDAVLRGEPYTDDKYAEAKEREEESRKEDNPPKMSSDKL